MSTCEETDELDPIARLERRISLLERQPDGAFIRTATDRRVPVALTLSAARADLEVVRRGA